jgi:putative two-component system response regulator
MDQPKIVIADDVDTNRFVLRDIIQSMGYQPILTENGEQVIKVVEHLNVDLIILDVAMPVMDGYECCARLKENVNTREIPIIFISAFDDPSDIVKGLELGGADCEGACGAASEIFSRDEEYAEHQLQIADVSQRTDESY